MSRRCYLAGRLTPLYALACLALLLPGVARAGEAHYLLVFASQRVPNNPNYSHTFATFVRASWPGDGPCPPCPVLEVRTLSWLPRSLVVRTLALLPECGCNLGLHETLQHVLSNEERVSLWGPYRIDRELYRRALRQAALLESGWVLYKANDRGYHSDDVSNCVHAVSSLADGYRLRFGNPGWGDVASYRVLDELMPWVLDRERVYYWVSGALGLGSYPIIYRGWDPPRSGILWGSLDWLFGRQDGVTATYGPVGR
jgi:hypothetical protein